MVLMQRDWTPRDHVMRELIRWIVYGTLLAGCTTTQTTQNMTITEDTALVSFVGHSGDDREKLISEAISEVAKVTRAHGYRYFVILDTADASQIVTRYVPTRILSVQNARRTNTNTVPNPNPGYYDYITPGRTVKELRPGLDIAIRMYREGAIDATREGVWNSAAIVDGQQ
jgi:hypothetical protein